MTESQELALQSANQTIQERDSKIASLEQSFLLSKKELDMLQKQLDRFKSIQPVIQQPTTEQEKKDTIIAPLVEKLNLLKQQPISTTEQDITIQFIYTNEPNTQNDTIDACMVHDIH